VAFAELNEAERGKRDLGLAAARKLVRKRIKNCAKARQKLHQGASQKLVSQRASMPAAIR
jgi:hypothetical protein